MSKFQWIKVSWSKNYAPNYIACCPHLDNPNMLLLAGVPTYLTDNRIKDILSKFGSIVNISSQKKPSATPKFHVPNNSKFFRNKHLSSSFRCTFIQYLDSSGLQECLDSVKMGLSINISDGCIPKTGTQKWSEEYRSTYPNEDELRSECEMYMAEFDEREKLKLQREKEMSENPDEDGWITVTKSNKLSASADSAVEKKKIYDKKMEKKKKEMLHLYNFQAREKRKEAYAVLKQKFQEDREKIAKMKAARKFKPY